MSSHAVFWDEGREFWCEGGTIASV